MLKIEQEMQSTDEQQLVKLLWQSSKDAIESYKVMRTMFIALAAVASCFFLIGLAVVIIPLILVGLFGGIASGLALYLTVPKIRFTKVGQFGIPLKEFKIQGTTMLVDRSGLIPPTTFNYPSLDSGDIKKVAKGHQELKLQLDQLPIVMSPPSESDQETGKRVLGQEEGRLVALLWEIDKTFQGSRTFSRSIPVLHADRSLREYLSRGKPAPSKFNIAAVTEASVQEAISQIEGVEVEAGKPGADIDIDEVSRGLRLLTTSFRPRYAYTLDFSLRGVNYKYSRLHAERVSDTAFNYYCPYCNEELIRMIESGTFYHDSTREYSFNPAKRTRMRLEDPVLRTWKCPVCEQVTPVPFKVHKLDDELFKPTYESLMNEHRLKRLDIYNQINDQKRSYSEKAEVQMHQVMREERAKADAIKSKLRSINAEIRADEATIISLGQIMIKYKRLAEEQMERFRSDIASIKKQIADSTAVHQKELDAQFNSLREGMNQRLEIYKGLEREEDRKKFELQAEMLKTTKEMKDLQYAVADRQGLFDKSNWNPLNWGYNLDRAFSKTVRKAAGASDFGTSKDLPKS